MRRRVLQGSVSGGGDDVRSKLCSATVASMDSSGLGRSTLLRAGPRMRHLTRGHNRFHRSLTRFKRICSWRDSSWYCPAWLAACDADCFCSKSMILYHAVGYRQVRFSLRAQLLHIVPGNIVPNARRSLASRATQAGTLPGSDSH